MDFESVEKLGVKYHYGVLILLIGLPVAWLPNRNI